MPTTRIKEKLSELISTQLPEHIVSEYPTFVKFLEYYYQFLEQDQHSQELLQNAKSYSDIDTTIDSFVEYFLNTYAKDFPANILADKTILIKHIQELYKTKGSENAYRILFRLLYNEEIDFFYPNEILLKPSDGKWIEDYILRVEQEGNITPFSFLNTKITGNSSSATGFVESVISFNTPSGIIYELTLDRNSIAGVFQPREIVYGYRLDDIFNNTNTLVLANITPILRSVDIIDGGLGYADELEIVTSGGTGSGALGRVTATTDSGSIKEIKLSNFGYDYDVKPNISVGLPTATVKGTYSITDNVAIFKLSNSHSLLHGDNVIVQFSQDNRLNTLIYGKANLINGSNILVFTDNTLPLGELLNTNFTSEILVNDVLKINNDYEFTVASIKSNSEVYLSSTSTSSLYYAEVFKANPSVNDLTGQTSNVVVSTILNPIAFKVNSVANLRDGFITSNNVNTKGNVTLTYTINKIISSKYNLLNNIVYVTTPVDHYLKINDNIKATYRAVDRETYTVNYILKNASNVLINYDKNHGFEAGDKVNVTILSRYSNATVGTFSTNITATNKIINVDFKGSQYFTVGQNVAVDFKETFSNTVYGNYYVTSNTGAISNVEVYLDIDSTYNIGSTINVLFTSGVLTDSSVNTQLPGKVNVRILSNTLIGTSTYFNSNLKTGNVITVDNRFYYTIANVVSNTFAYLVEKATLTYNTANIYKADSNLAGNTLVTTVANTSLFGKRTLSFFTTNRPNTKGRLVITNNLPRNLENTTLYGNVISASGNPASIKINLYNASNVNNTRGNVVISNSDTSNIILLSSNNITVVSTPTSKSLYVNLGISSNIASNGTISIGPHFTNSVVNQTGTYTVTGITSSRGFTYNYTQSNSRGNVDITVSRLPNLIANIGALAISQGRWQDDSGILNETYRIQGKASENDLLYYQQFSYVIKTSQTLEVWKDIVKKLIHPAGFEVFAEVLIDTTLVDVGNVTATSRYYPIFISGPLDASVTSITVDTIDYTVDNVKA